MINIKYILDERFYLYEADDAEAAEVEGATNTVEAESNTADWELLYKGCKNNTDFIVFWDGSNNASDPDYLKNGYWKTVWKEDADTVKSFGKAWMKFIVLNGFTAENNCFIAFLENVKANKLDNFKLKLSDIQPAVFQAMLKAYASNDLSEKYLRLEGDSLEKHNLIYYPGFYAVLDTEVEKLLELQSNAHSYGKKGIEFRDIFCQNGNIFKLKPIDQIKKALKAAGAGEKETISDKKAQALLDGIQDTKTAQAVLAALNIAYSITNAQALNGIKGLDQALAGVQITAENAKKVLTKFKLNNAKAIYKNETAAVIIKGLIAKILGKDPNVKAVD